MSHHRVEYVNGQKLIFVWFSARKISSFHHQIAGGKLYSPIWNAVFADMGLWQVHYDDTPKKFRGGIDVVVGVEILHYPVHSPEWEAGELPRGY